MRCECPSPKVKSETFLTSCEMISTCACVRADPGVGKWGPIKGNAMLVHTYVGAYMISYTTNAVTSQQNGVIYCMHMYSERSL